ncbi:hypothetical protein PILCRDRAFT_7217 [Piloderma croceum F 1598]|uniref:Uncharacterized protein n=1 Tax=Piloderma croceum (strain F 1598) TaxID=765440 RepID=A0A0C3FYF8_PILCF|nr:hypothetical protein PILCRDRAFT_7217 [Piloderma croceum F 1598]
MSFTFQPDAQTDYETDLRAQIRLTFDEYPADGSMTPTCLCTWARTFCCDVSLYVRHFPVNEEIQIYIDRAVDIVDPVATDDWAEDCVQLMLAYQSRVCCEQEATCQAAKDAARQAAEDRFNEERRIYSEERRRMIGVQLDADKRERDNQQRLRKEERARNRVQRTQELRLLSPTSSRTIAKRKSGSSIGERIVKGEGQSGCAGTAGSAKSPGGVQAEHPCERCAKPTAPFRCFIVLKSRQCVKCKAGKQKCVFPGGASPRTQIAALSAQAGPLTPRPRRPAAPFAPSGSQRQLEPTPTQVREEIATIAEAFRLTQGGSPPTSVKGLCRTHDMLSKHLQSDYRKVRLLLDWYNLTVISLQEVEKWLCQLTGEDDEEEYDEDEDEGDDSDGEGDDGGDGDFDDGSAGPFVDAE